MNNSDKYRLASQLVYDADSAIHDAILMMHHKDRWSILRHLVAASAYLREAILWWECPQCEQRLARLRELIEAVSQKQWEKAWLLFWGVGHSIVLPAPPEHEEDTMGKEQ